MHLTPQQKTYAIAATIFLSSFLLFSGCSKYEPPKITLNQLDLKNQVSNPFKIKKYNRDTCELEFEAQDPQPLSNMSLHGGVCLTADDYTRLKASVKAECINEKN